MRQGGGPKRIEKEHAKGKWTARERLDKLFDPGCERLEIGALAGHGMYERKADAPPVAWWLKWDASMASHVWVANDATVKAGAWFPITGKKNLRAQEIALENRLPIIYLVDSAGVYLPMQDEIFPDKEHFGRMFRNNAKLSSAGIPQIAAVMGSCVAGRRLPPHHERRKHHRGRHGLHLLGGQLPREGRHWRGHRQRNPRRRGKPTTKSVA